MLSEITENQQFIKKNLVSKYRNIYPNKSNNSDENIIQMLIEKYKKNSSHKNMDQNTLLKNLLNKINITNKFPIRSVNGKLIDLNNKTFVPPPPRNKSDNSINKSQEETPLFYNSILRNILRKSKKNNKNFNINIKKNNNNKNIIQVKIGPYMKNRKNINQEYLENYCFNFSINLNDKKLYEIYLKKCSLFSGTEILYKLEEIAKKFALNKIYLEDASEITVVSSTNKEYVLSLKYICILSEGISWYNKFKYISPFFEEEKIHNKIIMETPLSNYMSLILDSEINYLEKIMSRLCNSYKEEFNNKKLHSSLKERINNLKKIIKEKYKINKVNITTDNITDNMLLEAIKLKREYAQKRDNIIKKNSKFIEYINTRSSNLFNDNKNKTTISTIIQKFRKKIKTIKLDDSELEFIKYILDSSSKILKYDSKLMKIIE
jgi:hypothetical protein